MAEALVSVVLDQLVSTISGQIQQEVGLIKSVHRKVERITRIFQSIKAVIHDADMRRFEEETVQLWVDRLKDVCYELEDVLDEWNSAIPKLHRTQDGQKEVGFCCLISDCFGLHSRIVKRRAISHKIRRLTHIIDEISRDRANFSFKLSSTKVVQEIGRAKTTSFVDESKIHGRDHHTETLLRILTSESSNGAGHLPVVTIVGMGGIGKTTLAQLIYKHEMVNDYFLKKIWVCVSDPFDEIRIARAIIEGLKGSAPNLFELENLLQQISEFIKGLKLLLVLDDIWAEDYKKWEPFRSCLNEAGQGSKILLTTRNERVAKLVNTSHLILLKELSADDCWLIFSEAAFCERSLEEREGLEGFGRKLVDRCKGLPLAAKVLGGLMQFKSSDLDWKNVLDSNLWELDEAKREILSPLWLSYSDLSPSLKQCFSYCAMFPKDTYIYVNDLVKLWMANGFIGSTEMGRQYFDYLAMRYFFQELRKEPNGRVRACKMHDIMHDLALLVSKNECHAFVALKDDTTGMRCSFQRLRHLSFMYHGNDPSYSPSVNHCKGLHTLVGELHVKDTCIAMPNFFCHLTHLRALSLRCERAEHLPMEIGKLIHLRYLKLVFGGMKELPETLCDLCNLQSLELEGCTDLMRLPARIGSLTNMIHLSIPFLNDHGKELWMPRGIGALTSLQTLSVFNVSRNDDDGGCKIRDLKELKWLHGELYISGLGEVDDAMEAERATLKDKKQLRRLNFGFSLLGYRSRGEDPTRRDLENAILEALEPPPYLERLCIYSYQGSKLAGWIASLSKLSHLALMDCPNLESFPDGFSRLPVEALWVQGCSILEQRCQEGVGECWPLVSHVPLMSIGEATMVRGEAHN